MNSNSYNKFMKLVETHKNSADFNAINLKKSKITLTADIKALIDKYNMKIRGNCVYFN